MDFVGTFNDTIYGGNIDVCVTLLSTGEYIGQALFSEVGYMRGEINSTSNVWAGNFWTAGEEVKQGTYSLSVTSGSSSMTGTFTEKPGITYSVTYTKNSASTPSDLACFKTDAAYLVDSPPVKDFTGKYWIGDSDGYATNTNQDTNLDQITSSYQYYYEDGTPSPGILYHTPTYMNGQVSAGMWYEGGDEPVLGIELWVAKNATAYYETWWYCTRMADFNFTALSMTEDEHGIDLAYMTDSTCSVTTATENSCYMLPTSAEEQSCISLNSSSNGSDALAIAGIVGGGVALVAGAYCAYVVRRIYNEAAEGKKDTPMARKDEASNNL